MAVATWTPTAQSSPYDVYAQVGEPGSGVSWVGRSQKNTGITWFTVDHTGLISGDYVLFAIDDNGNLVYRVNWDTSGTGGAINSWGDVEDGFVYYDDPDHKIAIWDNGQDKIYIFTEPTVSVGQGLVTVSSYVPDAIINCNPNNGGNIIGSGGIESIGYDANTDTVYFIGPRGLSSTLNDSEKQAWTVGSWLTVQASTSDLPAATQLSAGPVARPSGTSIGNVAGACDFTTDGQGFIVTGAGNNEWIMFWGKDSGETWEERWTTQAQAPQADCHDNGHPMEAACWDGDTGTVYNTHDSGAPSDRNLQKVEGTYTSSSGVDATVGGSDDYNDTYFDLYGSSVVISLSVGIPRPTVSADSPNVSPQPVAATATVPTPTISTTSGATVSPAAVSAPATVPAVATDTEATALTITARGVTFFYRVFDDGVPRLTLPSAYGRGGSIGLDSADGWEKVSSRFVLNESNPGREHAMATVESAWSVHKSAVAPTLKTAIDEALTAAGYRDSKGKAL